MRSNCILFSVALWWRRGGKGYLVVRRSRWGRFPHWLYAEQRKKQPGERGERWRSVSYVPLDPKRKHCPPPLFVGRVQWGD